MDAPIEARKTTFLGGLRFVLVAGGGLFVDGYLNTIIGLVVPMLGYLYFQDQKGAIPTGQSSAIKAGFNIGQVLGQLGFGILGDLLGRSRVYGKECLFAIFGTFMFIMLPWHGLSQDGIVAWVTVFRVVTGIGAGGDYPMTSALSAESKIFSSRARQVMFIFSFNYLGALAAGLVLMILLAAFKGVVEADINKLEWVWRLLLGIGIIPALLTLYARLKMKETQAFVKYVSEEKRNHSDQFRDFVHYFSDWRHALALFIVAANWFWIDIVGYGIVVNQGVVLANIGYGAGPTKYLTLWNTAVGNVIVNVAGTLPGEWIGMFFPDILGRKLQQNLSCAALALLYAVWAGVNDKTSPGGQVALFAISQFALGLGVSMTIFLFPAELFPTRVRGTAHGISAATGKVGAIVVSLTFGSLVNNLGLARSLGLFAGFAVLIVVLTLLIPEPNHRTLDEIENDVMFDDFYKRFSKPKVSAGSAEILEDGQAVGENEQKDVSKSTARSVESDV